MTFTTPQPRFQSFFGGRFFPQNCHFGITKRITKHNFLVLQSTYLYFISNEEHTFEKKNVSFLLVTSTLRKVMIYLFNLKMCFVFNEGNFFFQGSIPITSIHFCMFPLQEFKLRIEHMNLAAEPEGWKVILHPNINFLRCSCDHDLTNHSRE